jgi:7-alpha-hydroxysteroid dehydrogenase
MTVQQLFDLDGQVALVTGAGKGIGRACALGLAEAGADVVLAARTAADLEAVAAEIEQRGRRAVVAPFDVLELERLGELVERATSELGGLDVLVNNAGGWPPQPLLATSVANFEQAFRFNVTTAFELTKQAVPAMLAGGGGCVVNISSAIGRLADRGYAAYGTAKAALAHLSRLTAMDLAPHIRVNAIAVGSVSTDALAMVLTPELRAQMEAATPVRRIGEIEEIAAAVVYLASPAGAYLTGKVLEVDGGIDHPNLALGLPDLEPPAPAGT